MIKVINKYKKKADDIEGFLVENIMRGSVFGNPFIIRNNSEKERDIVVCKYHEYLRNEYAKKDKIYQELHSLALRVVAGENIALECCCAPKKCHGDIIILAINGIIKKFYSK